MFDFKMSLRFNFLVVYRFQELTGVKTGGRIFLGKDSDFPVFTEGLAILEKPIAEAVELDGHVDSIDKTFSLFQLSSTMNIQGK